MSVKYGRQNVISRWISFVFTSVSIPRGIAGRENLRLYSLRPRASRYFFLRSMETLVICSNYREKKEAKETCSSVNSSNHPYCLDLLVPRSQGALGCIQEMSCHFK